MAREIYILLRISADGETASIYAPPVAGSGLERLYAELLTDLMRDWRKDVAIGSNDSESALADVIGRSAVEEINRRRHIAAAPEPDRGRAEMKAYLLDKAQQGDSTMQMSLAVLLVAEAMSNRDPIQLNEAEAWYRRAADQGDARAKRYLEEQWPREKAAIAESFKSKPEQ